MGRVKTGHTTTNTASASPHPLRVRSFVVLFGAEVQSLVGDQLARVALSVLVFNRTHNAAATALTYAATFLPAIVSGAFLARIGDKLPRLHVIVGCDIARAAAFTAMAVPSAPLGLMVALVVVSVLLEPAFSAAQSSYLAGRLDDEQYHLATELRMGANQLGQVGGFAAGGALVALFGAHRALGVDAVTFAVSALVITVGIGIRAEGWRNPGPTEWPNVARVDAGEPAESPASSDPDALCRPWRIRDDRRVVLLIALSSLAGLTVVPEGLAVPYAHAIGQSTPVAGLLLAAIPAGGALGAIAVFRIVPQRHRGTAALVMATVSGLPLVVTGWTIAWGIVLACWAVSGFAAAYQVEVFAALARLAPDPHRARTIGFASASLTTAQGVGLAVFGGVASLASPGVAIAIAGASAVVGGAVVTAVSQGRHTPASRSRRSIAGVSA